MRFPGYLKPAIPAAGKARLMNDPNALTNIDWLNLSNWLTMYWIYFPVVILFAFSLMIAHAFIPSAVQTGHLPPAAERLRWPLTIFALLLLAVAVVLMTFIIILTPQALGNIYDRFLM